MVPPWVEEHPDVFSDPDFSVTAQTDASEMSLISDKVRATPPSDSGKGVGNEHRSPIGRHEAWVRHFSFYQNIDEIIIVRGMW